MGVALRLAGRNIRIFLRDRTSVFFSLLSMIIIIGLYALFLGNVNVDSIRQITGEVPGIRYLVDSWIMAGILVVNSVTLVLGVYGTLIEDRQRKRLGGFLTAPIHRSSIVLGYIIAAWAVGVLINLIAFLLAEAYIVIGGGKLLSVLAMLKVIGLNALNVFSSAGIMFFIIVFVRTSNAYAALSTIVGTVIGFLTGIYLPVGVLPEAVQGVVKFVPATYGTVLMRQIFMEDPVKTVFANVPPEVADNFLRVFGVKLSVFGEDVPALTMLAVIVVAGALFYALSVLVMRKRKLE